VLESLLSLTGSNFDTRRSVESWLEQESRPVRSPPAAASDREFARTVVHYLIRNALEKASASWNQPADCRSPRPIDEQPVLLPAAEEDLHRALSITGSSASWLSDRLGSSISHYLTKQFVVDHRREFRGRPLYLCEPVPGEDSLLVTSSRALRRVAAADGGLASSAGSQRAQSLLRALAARLTSSTEWAAADT
jgi:hypothetical protein